MDKNLCKAPFYALNLTAYGYTPCCSLETLVPYATYEEYLASDELKRLKLSHTCGSGVPISKECNKCMNTPEATEYNMFSFKEDNTDFDNRKLTHMNIGNTLECGYECYMCSVNHKRHQTIGDIGCEHLGYYVPPPTQPGPSTEEVLKLIKDNIATLNRVNFVGGDPTLNEVTPKALEMLADSDVEVIYIYNGHLDKLTDGTSLIERLKKINKLRVLFSTDGPGEISEYIRRGYKQERFDRRIKAFSDALPGKIETLTTLGNINVLRIERVYEYLSKLIDDDTISIINAGVILNPDWASVNNLPPKLFLQAKKDAKRVLDKYKDDRHFEMLNGCLESALANPRCNNDYWRAFMIDRQKVDERYQTNVLALMPEFKPYWLV